MKFEHLIYSAAIAILIYTIYKKRYILPIIIGSAYSPDIDVFIDSILKNIGITVLIYGQKIKHGDFHNISVMIIYAILIALLLQTIHIKFRDSFLCAIIGFGAHLFEDALVFNPGYRFFWPLSNDIFGIGIVRYEYDFYDIANKDVLLTGYIFLMISIIIYFWKKNSTNTDKEHCKYG